MKPLNDEKWRNGTVWITQFEHWANGCEECERGIVLPPPVPRGYSVADVRRAQAARGELTFCECRAGEAMRRFCLGDVQTTAHTPTFNGAA